MTYGDFLDTLISPIQAFLSWATTITTALLGNYFFITLVGIVVDQDKKACIGEISVSKKSA